MDICFYYLITDYYLLREKISIQRIFYGDQVSSQERKITREKGRLRQRDRDREKCGEGETGDHP